MSGNIGQTIKALGLGSSTCWMCDGIGKIEVSNCAHDTRRQDRESCTEKCMRNEVCFNCGGRGRE